MILSMKAKRTGQGDLFQLSKKRKVELSFTGGDVTSDGGVMLLRQADNYLNLLSAVAKVFSDGRAKHKVKHNPESIIRQRVYGIALGNEDLNDHQTLRRDPAWQCAVGEDDTLASSATLSRFESQANHACARKIHEVLVDRFIESHTKTPKELILDVDATDLPIYGNQEKKFFHGYYGHHCFLPLYVTCGNWVLVSYLRPSNIDAAKNCAAVIRVLVKKLKRAWGDVKITIRGDSGFCRQRLLKWCERNDVSYVIGIARNSRLEAFGADLIERAKSLFEELETKQRLFTDFNYQAGSWDRARRVVMKAEHSEHGRNPRFVITNLPYDCQEIYDEYYCPRGDMENRIKQQFELFADRVSCQKWWPNQYRLLLSTLAYTLLTAIRDVGLRATELAQCQAKTIRLKLLKVGAIIIHNTRKVKFLLSSSFPYQDEFTLAAERLQT